MQEKIGSRIKHAWNAFMNRDPTRFYDYDGPSSGRRPDQVRLRIGNERSIISSIYNRIALDVASTSIHHAKLDEEGRFIDIIRSGLNDCLTVEANIDQTGKAFLQDSVMSMCDEGVVALVPTDTTANPLISNSYDILSIRTARIIEWKPSVVKLNLYNDRSGQKEEIILPKKNVAIVENPLYAVMNEPNSTLRRLISKLNLLDAIDEQSGSGKLDLIIQLPYVVKSDIRRNQAEKRRKDIESQLTGSKYGIAYTDGTEKITQLNRSVENNLMGQIEYLTRMLYSQLGLTESVFDGTADDKVLANYYSRTIEPIVSAIAGEMQRKFLTKTARSQKQTIYYFKDPFKFVPISLISEIADKFTRNEIMSSNEVRHVIGMRPAKDPKADELRNKNLSPAKQVEAALAEPQTEESTEE